MDSPTPQILPRPRRLLAASLPYFAVLLGVLILDSAWTAMLIYHLGIAAILVWHKRHGSVRLILRGAHPRLLLLLTIPFALPGAALYLLLPIVGVPAEELSTVLSSVGLDGPPAYIFVVYALALNPLLEELYWRHLLIGKSNGPIPEDLLFGGYHALVLAAFIDLPWALSAGLSLAVVGWFWRRITTRTGGLATAYVTHLVADISVVVGVWTATN